MKWSLRLGRFFGIDLFLHFTFLLFLLWIWYETRAQGLAFVAFFLSAFTCVVLHEYGHALTARRFGIGTRDITLLPIGGIARLEKMPSDPREELLVAIAGPAVNVAIAALLWGVCLLAGINPDPKGVDHMIGGGAAFLVTLLWWNVIMVAFNMLPAFPMDGGRVLRAALAMRMDYAKATRWAATTGKVMALIFGSVAIFFIGSPMLIVIAFFVWIGAGEEAAAAEQKAMLAGVRVRDAMLVDFRRVGPDETAGTVAQIILQGWQADFPVIFDGKVVGVISWKDVIRGLNGGRGESVSTFMRHDVPSCLPSENLEIVLERMRELELPLMPVVEDDRLLGLVTPENTIEFMLIRRALEKR
jgi:Zn-dependent protease/predicted transcriptional regulator